MLCAGVESGEWRVESEETKRETADNTTSEEGCEVTMKNGMRISRETERK